MQALLCGRLFLAKPDVCASMTFLDYGENRMAALRRFMKPHAIHPCPPQERLSRTFENGAGSITRRRVVNRSARNDFAVIAHRFHHDYQLGIAQNRDVWIMGDDNNLAPLFGAPKHWNKGGIYEFAIEIVFRLIDYEGAIAVG